MSNSNKHFTLYQNETFHDKDFDDFLLILSFFEFSSILAEN